MAKVIFAVPPVKSEKGIPTASQNRQYQMFKDPFFAYPIIPAILISMVLQEPGNEVLWVDSVAEDISDIEFGKVIVDMNPDYIVFEANTMLANNYYQYVNDIKNNLPNIKILFCGEHVTAMPEEARQKCKADYFLHGGKWYYDAFKIILGKDWGKERLLPHINREATRWWLYAYANGNFKYVPATYMMAAQDCWYRPKGANGESKACTFCTWVDYHPENVIRPVDDMISEVEGLVNFGFREFFDDSGTFPVGKWLKEFCDKMTNVEYDVVGQKKTLNQCIAWGCNMRFGALQPEEFKMMAKAGCRFILWGFESANQKTLDMLNKGTKIERIKTDLIHSRMAGIWNHLTIMFGYPWEDLEEEMRTYKMGRWLMLNDWSASAQATICMPYPGTALFKQCKDNGWLLNEDWTQWDMSKPVMKLKYDWREALKMQKGIYDVSYHPKFIINKLSNIRTTDDLKFYLRLGRKVVNRFGLINN